MKRSILFILIFFLTYTNIIAADSTRVKNLVFEGAGIRGIAYGGVISALEEKGILISVERVGGTSAGAIAAMALCIGYSGQEITDIISSTRFSKFNDGHFMFIGGFNRMNRYYGWYRGYEVDQWLGTLIKNKTGNSDITFAELHANKKYKDLYVTGTCVNLQKVITFSHENYPNMKIRDAVRISMSIPFYFEAVLINEKGEVARHPRHPENYLIMIDGGVTANFPIRMFDSSMYVSSDTNMYNTFVFNNETLGIRIDSKEQIASDEQGAGLIPLEIKDFRSYTAAMYIIILENLNRSGLLSEDWERTISVSDEKITPRIRKITEQETSLLYQSGVRAVNIHWKNTP